MIGLFDSGAGGLSALAFLRKAAPRADILFFADEANRPLGEKTAEEILAISRAAIARLTAAGCTHILLACGTASAVALPTLVRESPVPLYGVTDPLAAACARAWRTRGGKILILGTRATVQSGALQEKICRFATHAPLLCLACPDFVPLSEELASTPAPSAERRVREVLSPFLSEEVGAVALGCTHFSRLGGLIAPLFPQATILDGAREAVEAMLSRLPPWASYGAGQTVLQSSAL